MNICFILPSLAKTGPNLVAFDIIKSLIVKKDFNIVVYYFKNNIDGISVIDFPCQIKKVNFFSDLKLIDFDIVHSHMLKADIYSAVYKTLRMNINVKFISTIHQIDMINLQYDYNSKLKAQLLSIIWRKALSKLDYVIYLSNAMKEYYKGKIKTEKNAVIYNGRDIDVKNGVLPFEKYENKSYIGTTCLLTKRKGLEQVIKVLKCNKEIVFVIIGSGPEKENLSLLVHKLGVSEQVKFLGFISEPFYILSQLDAFILPSRGEGFPLALIEAAGLKLPCIASNIDIVSEVFTHEEISFFDLDDLKSLSLAINNCLNDRESFSKKLHDKYKAELTLESMCNKYENVYLNVKG